MSAYRACRQVDQKIDCHQLEVYEGLNSAVNMPRYPSNRRERFLSYEEMQRFMEGVPHLPSKPRAYFLTLLLTGARLSELRACAGPMWNGPHVYGENPEPKTAPHNSSCCRHKWWTP
jgi:integrase